MDCFVEFQYLLLFKNWQKKKLFSQIKNQMSLYGYQSIKQQHMYRLKGASQCITYYEQFKRKRERKKEDVVPSC